MKIITRIKGGLGNQLFCYAAARRLAIVNNAEMVIDDTTGFARDRVYQRQYQLDHFSIPCRTATRAERLEPFGRYRRWVLKWLARRKPFENRCYLEQEGIAFDKRLLTLNVNGTIYLDGLWQSEHYFSDIAHIVRQDLRIIPPLDGANQKMGVLIRGSNSVALHVRWFNAPGTAGELNLPVEYYRRAIGQMEAKLDGPKYFLFSDHPEAACSLLSLPEDRVVPVSHNKGDTNAYADLWLMSQCRHFITANSTFSWWAAWLGERKGSIVLTPSIKQDRIQETNWGFEGLIPGRWTKV